MDLVGGIVGFGRFAADQSGAVALCGEGAGDRLTNVWACAEDEDDGRWDRHGFQCPGCDRSCENVSGRSSCFFSLLGLLVLDGILLLVI